MKKVLIAPAHLGQRSGPYYDVLSKAGFEMHYHDKPRQLTSEELLARAGGFPYILAGSEGYPRRILEQLPDLKMIARAGVGYDGVDIAAATELGIVVTNTPGANHEAVAEHCFGMMLYLLKNLADQDRRLRAGEWPRYPTKPLRGKTLGIVGLGRIGKAMALRAQVFGLKVLAVEPFPDIAFVKQHAIPLVTMDEMLPTADIVTLHVPLTETTRNFFSSKQLEQMKPGAILLNSARGEVLDSFALAKAMEAGKLSGAGIDVHYQEPLPPDYPLMGFQNVLLTAHTAGVDLQSRDDMGRIAAEAIAEVASGGWPTDKVVNPDVLSHRR
ncbi:MAG: phosphoglycerate dehydrogenase [Zavarzinella sp.]